MIYLVNEDYHDDFLKDHDKFLDKANLTSKHDESNISNIHEYVYDMEKKIYYQYRIKEIGLRKHEYYLPLKEECERLLKRKNLSEQDKKDINYELEYANRGIEYFDEDLRYYNDILKNLK